VVLGSHGRYNYSAITSRPDYNWPDGKRLAVYIALNLEHFSFGEGLGAQLVPSSGSEPDILNYAWRDYGNRVGAWRMLAEFERLKLPVAVLVNSEIYNYCPELMEAFRNRGDEVVGHGRTNSERQSTLNQKDEAHLIKEVTDTIEAHEGRRPKGWLGPWISESFHTPELLRAEGYEYVLDWCHDDQPTWFGTGNGRLLSIPYPQEVNDIPAIVVRKTGSAEFAEMIVDQIDEMLEQSVRQPLVAGIALHPYIFGQPFRLRHLRSALEHLATLRDRVWLTWPGTIAEHITHL
jgi:peptidoglycan/xylan/chitin deacetylase (PgdA/CDA1 family)